MRDSYIGSLQKLPMLGFGTLVLFVVLVVRRMDGSDVQHRELNHSIENNTGEGRRFTLEKTKSSC